MTPVIRHALSGGLFSRLTLLLVVLLCVSCSKSTPETKPPAPKSTKLSFCAMGDVPYTNSEYQLLQKQIDGLPEGIRFAVHLGDIKPGDAGCKEKLYEKVVPILKSASVPLFVLVGDNEWNDCSNPEKAWKHWTKHFLRFDQHWPHRLPVNRQWQREENFSFVTDEVLILSVNLVGGHVHDAEEWKVRHAQNVEWTKQNLNRFGHEVTHVIILAHASPKTVHDDYFEKVVPMANRLQKPTLYLHGNGHLWLHDQPFDSELITRVQVDQGGIAPPVLITVTDDPTQPFVFDRRRESQPEVD